jgi:MFS family permease
VTSCPAHVIKKDVTDMPESLNLKELERKAWQSFQQDGLMEVFLGALLVLAFLAGIAGEQRFFVYIVMLLLGPMLFLAKRYVTVPRIGQVQFGPKRKANQRLLAVVAVVAVGLTLALMLVAMRGSSWLRDNHVLISFGLGGMVALVFTAMAYLKDFPRLYIVGLLIGAAFTVTELLDNPAPLLVVGSILFVVGLAILAHFVRQYPVPSADVSHGSGHGGR